MSDAPTKHYTEVDLTTVRVGRDGALYTPDGVAVVGWGEPLRRAVEEDLADSPHTQKEE